MASPRTNVERTLGAEPAEVWKRLIEDFDEWVGPGSGIDPKPGGAVRGPDDQPRVGLVERVVPGEALSWVWAPPSDPADPMGTPDQTDSMGTPDPTGPADPVMPAGQDRPGPGPGPDGAAAASEVEITLIPVPDGTQIVISERVLRVAGHPGPLGGLAMAGVG